MSRRWDVPVAWAATVLLAGAVGAWGMWATLAPPRTGQIDAGPTLYTVSLGTVSRVQSFTAQARWDGTPIARNAAVGTVTSIDFAAGDTVEVGNRLFSVDLLPSVAAQGSVPAFRDLAEGARGDDVQQLQRFLTAVGMYSGEADGAFGSSTASAVRGWQISLGIEADGAVRAGDLVYLPDLPAKLAPDPGLTVGSRLSGGEPAVVALPPAPAFTITLGIEQAELVPLVTSVLVHHPGGTWSGMVASSTSTPSGELLLSLAGPDGGGICGDECAAVPVGEDTVYPVDLVAVPETTGPVVPVAALQSLPDGRVVVTDAAGTQHAVEVVASAEGRAVVDGLAEGSVVRLFATGGASAP